MGYLVGTIMAAPANWFPSEKKNPTKKNRTRLSMEALFQCMAVSSICWMLLQGFWHSQDLYTNMVDPRGNIVSWLSDKTTKTTTTTETTTSKFKKSTFLHQSKQYRSKESSDGGSDGNQSRSMFETTRNTTSTHFKTPDKELQSRSLPQYHVVFSTSCSDQQHWESMVFFYHAFKVRQPGTVTRIVGGCSAEQQQTQTDFFERFLQPMRPISQHQHDNQRHENYNNQFYIHFTPDYSTVQRARGAPYKYMNKRTYMPFPNGATLHARSDTENDCKKWNVTCPC